MNNTSLQDLQSWLGTCESLEPGFTDLGFIKPFNLVTLALRARQLELAELELPPATTSYAARMHLWDVIGLPPPVNVPERPPHGRFLPAETIASSDEVRRQAENLQRIAEDQGVEEDSISSLYVALIEILSNCQVHSDLPAGMVGVAAAQAWPTGHLAQIAIADLGIGVRASLAQNAAIAPRLTDDNACRIAAEYSVTSKPHRGHKGYGLTLARQMMEYNGGRFFLVSRDEAFMSWGAEPHEQSSATLRHRWPGTLVVLEWNLDRPLDVDRVYRNWPTPEGFDDDELEGFDDIRF